MKIKRRTPQEIKKNKEILKKSTFGLKDLQNKYRVSRNKPKKVFVIQKQTVHEPNFKFYKEGFVYKTMAKDKYRMWKELFDKGISVEQIEGTGNKILKEIRKEIKENNFEIKKGQVLVKSKAIGQRYLLGKDNQSIVKNLVTIERLIEKNVISQFTKEQKNSISLQITKITLQLLKNDYTHSHPHLGNWAIDISSKNPKVYLIDFDKIKKINNKLDFMTVNTDLLEIANIISRIRGEKQMSNEMYSAVSKKFTTYILKRNKELRQLKM